ncbi:NADH dehydrogenase-like protein [Colletotrichum chlorophyti]|uniref:NADH dehydrogenase-like protein n=1 Tax=Colletotrichum chlorophyti TaxID=708187 RepID=A0A1Q8RQ06_9PEZI|nr:NADH dehydrogenase-like protein [Colletotrichum chlorophyti]
MSKSIVIIGAGFAVSEVDSDGVTLASGERIASKTIIWTAGMRATPLTKQIPETRDALGRLHVNQFLQTPTTKNVFATGDAAYALADSKGHHVLMSCQHALQLGRTSGHNAAAALLNKPMTHYSQPAYDCCLDLGSWGAREVQLTGAAAKRVKSYINGTLIYPPNNVDEAIAAADPAGSNSDELINRIIEVVG